MPKIEDLDLEDTNPSVLFTFGVQFQGMVSYDKLQNTLIFKIPPVVPPTIILNKRYPLRFLLNDHNIDGEK